MKHFSLLDLSPIIVGGDASLAFRNTLDLAQHAEQWGYHRYWLAEHHNLPGIASAATSIVIGHVAGGTKTIRVGAGGIMLPNHSPLVIAEQFGTLDALYPGRIDLGLGRAPGSDQLTARALRRHLASSGDTFPQDVLELQSYFDVAAPDQALQAVPGAGANVPLYLLGSSDFSAHLAAELGLPFAFASHFAPDYLDVALALYRRNFRPSPALAMSQIGQFGIRAGQATETVNASFEALYASAADRVLNGTGREAFDAIKMLKSANLGQYTPANGAEYPRSPFGEALKQIAQLIKADVGLEVAFAESGNWDHHVNEGAAVGILANRLDDLARGVSALVRDLGDRMQDVVVLTMSEFGRAVAENGNRGTDHGHGNAMMIIGGPVRGGKVYGRWPGLAQEQRYDGRDLSVTTDFRSVFAEVVHGHLGLADTRPVFPGFTATSTLGFV